MVDIVEYKVSLNEKFLGIESVEFISSARDRVYLRMFVEFSSEVPRLKNLVERGMLSKDVTGISIEFIASINLESTALGLSLKRFVAFLSMRESSFLL